MSIEGAALCQHDALDAVAALGGVVHEGHGGVGIWVVVHGFLLAGGQILVCGGESASTAQQRCRGVVLVCDGAGLRVLLVDVFSCHGHGGGVGSVPLGVIDAVHALHAVGVEV